MCLCPSDYCSHCGYYSERNFLWSIAAVYLSLSLYLFRIGCYWKFYVLFFGNLSLPLNFALLLWLWMDCFKCWGLLSGILFVMVSSIFVIFGELIGFSSLLVRLEDCFLVSLFDGLFQHFSFLSVNQKFWCFQFLYIFLILSDFAV